jgi:hypothetical protein
MPTVEDAVLVPPVDPTQPPENPTACRNGAPYCILGAAPHTPCSSKPVVLTLPSHGRTVTALEAVIEDSGTGPVLAFCPDGHDAVEFTSGAQLRAVVASTLEHLPRLLALADQYDAMVGA